MTSNANVSRRDEENRAVAAEIAHKAISDGRREGHYQAFLEWVEFGDKYCPQPVRFCSAGLASGR